MQTRHQQHRHSLAEDVEMTHQDEDYLTFSNKNDTSFSALSTNTVKAPRYRCPTCDDSFWKKSSFAKHKKYHSNEIATSNRKI